MIDIYARVSIPNGDKHDFKTLCYFVVAVRLEVSIPNGDKHDFKTIYEISHQK